jgi:hypothetical protein
MRHILDDLKTHQVASSGTRERSHEIDDQTSNSVGSLCEWSLVGPVDLDCRSLVSSVSPGVVDDLVVSDDAECPPTGFGAETIEIEATVEMIGLVLQASPQ